MKRMLYIGDSPTVQTGFARVTTHMLDRLKDHFEVHLFGVNYNNTPHEFPYPIYPAAGPNLEYIQTEPYGGQKALRAVYEDVRPDLVVCNNDTWVVAMYYDYLQDYIQAGDSTFYGYIPVDGGPYHVSLVHNLASWTGCATYTEFGRKVLLDTHLRGDIKVIPHGTNTKDFFEMDRGFARGRLNLDPDTYYIFNGNRNQPRKRYDLLVKGYAEFISWQPRDAKISFFCHGGMNNNNGWNVPAMLERELTKWRVPLDRPLLSQYTNKPYPHNMVSIQMLNIMYNAMDVGINTAQGEGWGLVNSEHAVTGVPQIVPDHASLGELFADKRGLLMPVSWYDTERPYLIERGILNPHDIAKALDWAYKNQDKMAEMGRKAQKYFTSPELSWEHVSQTMLEWIEELEKANA